MVCIDAAEKLLPTGEVECVWSCHEHMGVTTEWVFTFSPRAEPGCFDLTKKQAAATCAVTP